MDTDSFKAEQTLGQNDLNRMRQDIDQIDDQIVSLLAKRQSIVEDVVEFKKKHNLPVYHSAREEDLISRRRSQAKAAGLDPNYIEELFRTILRRSRIEQTREMANKCIRPDAKILIVGGKGAMGNYFYRWFLTAGYHVRILDKDDWQYAEQLCQGIDLVMISVPIDVTEQVITMICPFLTKDCILSDITSIKESPMSCMLNAHPGPVIGLHPLFGPTTSTLDKQIIVATPGRHPSSYQWVLDQFSAWGSIIVFSTPQEHDEMMNIVQALRHFATFSFGQFLYKKKVPISKTLEFSSPIYRLELGMVGRLFAQDPSLYYEIIFASSDRRNLIKEYIISLYQNLDMIQKEDKQHFLAEFRKIAEWFGPFSEQAMRESTFLIDKLIERF